jgi:N-acetylmuramoyl-L-alanine amidase CwlA
MNISKNITTKINIKCPYSMNPTRIVVHNTANDASARNEVNYANNNDNYTSFHYAVDDIEIVQMIEENRNSFNAGDGAKGKGNREGISIEICYSKSGGDRFTKAEANAVHLIVDILRRYGWGIDKVTKHQDYSGKYCPHRTLDMGWQRFLNMIQTELNPAPIPTPSETYTLITNVPAYTNSTNAKNGVNSTAVYTSGEYYVFNKSAGMINITKTVGKAGGWINPADNVIKTVEPPKEEPKLILPTTEGYYLDKDNALWYLLADGSWSWKSLPGRVDRSGNEPMIDFAPFINAPQSDIDAWLKLMEPIISPVEPPKEDDTQTSVETPEVEQDKPLPITQAKFNWIKEVGSIIGRLINNIIEILLKGGKE